MCRRWKRDPLPTIAMVQGACIAGGLMLAWVCDLIVASDDAYFQDPVVRMGIPGVEYFAHAHELNRASPRNSYLGERMGPSAWQMGMVNKVVPRAELEAAAGLGREDRGAARMGLALTKTVINRVEDLQGLRTTMDIAFGYHHFAHTHSQLLGAGTLGGRMRAAWWPATKSGRRPAATRRRRLDRRGVPCARRFATCSAAATPSCRRRWAGWPARTWSPRRPTPAASGSWLAPRSPPTASRPRSCV